MLADVAALAGALHAAPSQDRDALRAVLTRVTALPEPAALAFAMRLGDVRGPLARAAADVALALGELDGRKEVAREARRSRLRLRSTGAPATLQIPPEPVPATGPAGPNEGSQGAAPRLEREPATAQLVEAYATRTREQGEVMLVLGWQEGQDPQFVRGYTFTLSFWNDGITEFAMLGPMRRSRFRQDTVETLRQQKVEIVSISWAQARRLILEALGTNEWRGTEPSPDFKRHQGQIARRLLDEPQTEQQRAAWEAVTAPTPLWPGAPQWPMESDAAPGEGETRAIAQAGDTSTESQGGETLAELAPYAVIGSAAAAAAIARDHGDTGDTSAPQPTVAGEGHESATQPATPPTAQTPASESVPAPAERPRHLLKHIKVVRQVKIGDEIVEESFAEAYIDPDEDPEPVRQRLREQLRREAEERRARQG